MDNLSVLGYIRTFLNPIHRQDPSLQNIKTLSLSKDKLSQVTIGSMTQVRVMRDGWKRLFIKH